MGENKKQQVRFYGYKHPLSNFYETNFRIGTFIYPSTEHFYQSQKSEDPYERMDILMADGPKEAKLMGRNVETLRPNWDKKRLVYMWKGLKAKFSQSEYLKKYLLDTKDAELIENSIYDSFWGCGKDKNGRNMMGKLLMKLRKEMRENGD